VHAWAGVVIMASSDLVLMLRMALQRLQEGGDATSVRK
jgi:hypothetical protein